MRRTLRGRHGPDCTYRTGPSATKIEAARETGRERIVPRMQEEVCTFRAANSHATGTFHFLTYRTIKTYIFD